MISFELPIFTLVNEPSNTVPYLRDLPDLLDSYTVVPQREQRPLSVGEFDDDDPESPGLTFTVFGEYRVPGGDWDALRRSVVGLASAGWFDVTVTTSVARTLRVRVVGTIIFDLIDESGYADFSIPLWAPDPRKYGPLQTQSTGLPVAGAGVVSPVTSPFSQIGGGNPGRVVLTNNGTTDTIPSFTVTGGGMSGGVELTRIETAQKLRLEWPLLGTDVVRFSPGDGQVWLNEQSPIAGYLTIADWWVLNSGETATVQFDSIGTVTGTPVLTAEWRDADS
ncbi:phage distal tail protein [Microbacterium sp. BR1]|uniref:phage distal tail protein n=1 Tax=Microbacterium sp. BR1 TaxID=1070896 RepID=UPI000C2C3E5D|nr:hypothetical protein [Microbacterium sp. BR1]